MSRNFTELAKNVETLVIKKEIKQRILEDFNFSFPDDILNGIYATAILGCNNLTIAKSLGITEQTLYNWFNKSEALRTWTEQLRCKRDLIANNTFIDGLGKDKWLAWNYLKATDKTLGGSDLQENKQNLTQINIESINVLSSTDLDALLKDKLLNTSK